MYGRHAHDCGIDGSERAATLRGSKANEGATGLKKFAGTAAASLVLQDVPEATVSAIDPLDIRKAFGTFLTGVTVVTTREPSGTWRGFTANSFTSVSLDPPLVLVCLSKAALSCETFAASRAFAVNVLSEGQQQVSSTFASKRPDKFTGLDCVESQQGNPLLPGTLAWFDCTHHQTVDAGDHIILMGRVASYEYRDGKPLGYARGRYVSVE